jgi:hypothetical protein
MRPHCQTWVRLWQSYHPQEREWGGVQWISIGAQRRLPSRGCRSKTESGTSVLDGFYGRLILTGLTCIRPHPICIHIGVAPCMTMLAFVKSEVEPLLDLQHEEGCEGLILVLLPGTFRFKHEYVLRGRGSNVTIDASGLGLGLIQRENDDVESRVSEPLPTLHTHVELLKQTVCLNFCTQEGPVILQSALGSRHFSVLEGATLVVRGVTFTSAKPMEASLET